MADGAAAIDRLDHLTRGFWVGWCSFELGHALERVHPRHASCEPRVVPDLLFTRFEARVVIDAEGGITIEGDGDGRRLLEDAVATDKRPSAGRTLEAVAPDRLEWASSVSRDEYAERVDTVLDLLRAGECYQVNLTRRLTLPRALDPTALYRALGALQPEPQLAMLRVTIDGGPLAVVSASPERFLHWHGRSVETKPIKGTAPDAHAARQRQGPRRERDDRRPRPQRPRSRVRARLDLGAVVVHGRAASPACTTS